MVFVFCPWEQKQEQIGTSLPACQSKFVDCGFVQNCVYAFKLKVNYTMERFKFRGIWKQINPFCRLIRDCQHKQRIAIGQQMRSKA